jgi:hypothetical protein
MSDSESQSPPPRREGFERRWIKNANYTGPERRSGVDRRRYPPVKGAAPSAEDAPSTDPDPDPDTADEPDSLEERPTPPDSAGTFKPYRP